MGEKGRLCGGGGHGEGGALSQRRRGKAGLPRLATRQLCPRGCVVGPQACPSASKFARVREREREEGTGDGGSGGDGTRDPFG